MWFTCRTRPASPAHAASGSLACTWRRVTRRAWWASRWLSSSCPSSSEALLADGLRVMCCRPLPRGGEVCQQLPAADACNRGSCPDRSPLHPAADEHLRPALNDETFATHIWLGSAVRPGPGCPDTTPRLPPLMLLWGSVFGTSRCHPSAAPAVQRASVTVGARGRLFARPAVECGRRSPGPLRLERLSPGARSYSWSSCSCVMSESLLRYVARERAR